MAALLCRAQDYRFHLYNREDGLPPTVIEDIRRSHDGYLWMAGWSGIYSFDGSDFSRFTSEMIPFNERYIRLEPDQERQTIFAIRHDGRLMMLRKPDNKIREIMKGRVFDKMFRLPGGEIMFTTTDGDVYTNSGAISLEDGSWQLSLYYSPGHGCPARDIFTDNNSNKYILYERGVVFNRRHISSQGAFCHLQIGNSIYLGSTGGSVLIIDEKGDITTHHTGTAGDIVMMSDIPSAHSYVIATSGNRLYRYTFDTGAREIEAPFAGETGFLCTKSSDGELWLYSKGGSLCRYDRSSDSFEPFHNPDRRDWNHENRLSAFFCDAQNIVWIASTLRGLEKAYRQDSPFRIRPVTRHQGPTIGNSVRSLLQTPDGRCFIATRDGRIHIYDRSMKEESVRWRVSGTVLSMVRDGEGRVWLGTDGNGVVENLAGYDDFPAFRPHYHHNTPAYYSANADHIHSLCVAPDKRIWVGSYDGGLSYIDISDAERRFINSRNVLDCPEELTGRIRHICMDPDSSSLYIAGTGGVIRCPNPKDKPDKMEFHPMESLAGYDIQHIMFSSSGLMYVASYGSGFICLNPDDPSRLTSYTTQEGLSSNYVLSSIEDRAGNIWIVTDVGLCRLDPKNGNISVFASDRIRSNTLLNEGQPIMADNGDICIGTNSGVLRFDPSAVSGSTYSPILLIRNFYLNGTRHDIDAEGLPAVHVGDHMTIMLKAIDMKEPGRVVYSYRLRQGGEEGKWQSLGTGDRVSIDFSRPGRYSLTMRSTNADGFQTGNDMTLDFKVRRSPAWIIAIASAASIAGIIVLTLLIRRGRRSLRDRARSGRDAFAVKFMELLDANLDNSEFDLDMACEALGMSRTTLYKRCRESFGNTPSACMTELRLLRASELLRDTDQSISQIAYACGFNDSHYFSRAFRKRFGTTASEYRSGR